MVRRLRADQPAQRRTTPSQQNRHDFDGVRWDPPALNETEHVRQAVLHARPPAASTSEPLRREYEGKLEELQDTDDQVGSGPRRAAGDRPARRDVRLLRLRQRVPARRAPADPARSSPTRSPAASRTSSAARGSDGTPGPRLVSQVDLMPTTLDIAGPRPGRRRVLDGRSMLRPLTTRRLVRVAPAAARRAPERRLGDAARGRPGADRPLRGGRAGALRPRSGTRTSSRSRHASTDTSAMTERLTALRQAAGLELRALEV